MTTERAPIWVACHDTIVCRGASQIQKWCVREGNKRGPLVAVMLTKEVAHALAAAPELLDLARNVGGFGDSLLQSADLNVLRSALREWRNQARAATDRATGQS